MRKVNRIVWGLLAGGLLMAPACGDDDGGAPVGSGDGGTEGSAVTTFEVRIENRSDASALPSPLAPGVYAAHAEDAALFTEGEPDRGLGLEALAEDGVAAPLADALAEDGSIADSGVFDTPEDGAEASPAPPGGTYRFTVAAEPGERLSFATMLVQTNDVFLAPDARGIALFDDVGAPLPERDVTAEVALWNAGTEVDEAPGMGPWQAPRQGAPDAGPAEGVVHAFGHATRTLPIGTAVAEVDVREADGTFTLTYRNIGEEGGAMVSPLAPVFWAVHDGEYAPFEAGTEAGEGLERLAEEGDPSELVAEALQAPGVADAGAAAEPLEAPGTMGPIAPGQSFEFAVTPSPDYPWLSFASMIGQTNDVFVSPGPVRLIDAAGALRPAEEVRDEIRGRLAVWDAGTEVNQVPGVGLDQAPRQPAPDTGEDEGAVVGLYADATNDLAGPWAGGVAALTVTPGEAPGTFEVSFVNTSDQTAFPSPLAPMLWMVHGDDTRLFEPDAPASAGLEWLAEEGDPSRLAPEAAELPGVTVGVVDLADGASEAGPVPPGDRFVATVPADADAPWLTMASMVGQSNDTFLSLGPIGVRLVDEAGAPREPSAIAADVEAAFGAWDAGTELNQAGAIGPDQAPRQSAPDTGPEEGVGTVRAAGGEVWAYPSAEDLVRVVVRPLP